MPTFSSDKTGINMREVMRQIRRKDCKGGLQNKTILFHKKGEIEQRFWVFIY